MDQSPQKEKLPIVLKQLWTVTLPSGEYYQAGASYHLSEAHRNAYVAQIAARMIGPDDEREEPVGDPIPVHVNERSYEELVRLGGTDRIK